MSTAIVVSQLSGRARARHLDAVARQRDLERLYTLSRGLLLAEEGGAAPTGIARHIADAFELEGLALYDQHTGTIVRAGRTDLPDIDARLRDVARQATTRREPGGLVVTAVRLGQTPIGSLALQGGTMSDTVLQSVANLAAIGLERARERDAATATEAARRSGELRAALLDAVAHEFKTPLTSIRAAAGGLTGLGDDGRRPRAAGHRRRGVGAPAGPRQRRDPDVPRRGGRLRRAAGAARPPRARRPRRSASSARGSPGGR